MKRKLLISLLVIVFLLTIITLISNDNKKSLQTENKSDLLKSEINTLNSLKKIDDYPLYVMHFEDGYGFEEYLKTGRDITDKSEIENNNIACSCISVFNEHGDSYFGRNLDWYYSPVLVLFTDPPDGFASVSIVDIKYLGFNNKDDITKMSIKDKQSLLYSPYLPFDGMNEYGVCIGEMAMRSTKFSYDPEKISISCMEIMRLVLDHAKNTNDAIKLFKKYNIVLDNESPPMHYMISDPSGDSAIIEFINGEIKVIKNAKPYQIATNFQIYGKTSDELKGKCIRYDTAYKTLSKSNEQFNNLDVMKLMKAISQSSTQWSSVYNMNTGEIQITVGRKYDNIKKLKLPFKKIRK
ncbi:MAG: linear amide C-N hydrolase [Firmicutes bacterium]|nr:linear amide C-N hydrolase [Bacillota bacterium]